MSRAFYVNEAAFAALRKFFRRAKSLGEHF
jgi:hypothetical protein